MNNCITLSTRHPRMPKVMTLFFSCSEIAE